MNREGLEDLRLGLEGEQGRGGTEERLEKGREEQGRPGGVKRSTGGVKPGRGRICYRVLHLLRRGAVAASWFVWPSF